MKLKFVLSLVFSMITALSYAAILDKESPKITDSSNSCSNWKISKENVLQFFKNAEEIPSREVFFSHHAYIDENECKVRGNISLSGNKYDFIIYKNGVGIIYNAMAPNKYQNPDRLFSCRSKKCLFINTLKDMPNKPVQKVQAVESTKQPAKKTSDMNTSKSYQSKITNAENKITTPYQESYVVTNDQKRININQDKSLNSKVVAQQNVNTDKNETSSKIIETANKQQVIDNKPLQVKDLEIDSLLQAGYFSPQPNFQWLDDNAAANTDDVKAKIKKLFSESLEYAYNKRNIPPEADLIRKRVKILTVELKKAKLNSIEHILYLNLLELCQYAVSNVNKGLSGLNRYTEGGFYIRIRVQLLHLYLMVLKQEPINKIEDLGDEIRVLLNKNAELMKSDYQNGKTKYDYYNVYKNTLDSILENIPNNKQ